MGSGMKKIVEKYPSKQRKEGNDKYIDNFRTPFQKQEVWYLPHCLKEDWNEFVKKKPSINYEDWMIHTRKCADCATASYGIRMECTVKGRGNHLKQCKQCQELKILHEQKIRHYFLYNLKQPLQPTISVDLFGYSSMIIESPCFRNGIGTCIISRFLNR